MPQLLHVTRAFRGLELGINQKEAVAAQWKQGFAIEF